MGSLACNTIQESPAQKGLAAILPAKLEATADLNVHNAARKECGAKPVEPEVWGHHHMSWGKPSVEYLADKHQHSGLC